MGHFDGYLLVSDMDGTLLNSKGKLSEENKRAIEYFVDNGGQFTLATGRMLPSVKRHIHKLKVTLPVIMYNGTKIYDFSNDEVIYEKFLEEERKEISGRTAPAPAHHPLPGRCFDRIASGTGTGIYPQRLEKRHDRARDQIGGVHYPEKSFDLL